MTRPRGKAPRHPDTGGGWGGGREGGAGSGRGGGAAATQPSPRPPGEPPRPAGVEPAAAARREPRERPASLASLAQKYAK